MKNGSLVSKKTSVWSNYEHDSIDEINDLNIPLFLVEKQDLRVFLEEDIGFVVK